MCVIHCDHLHDLVMCSSHDNRENKWYHDQWSRIIIDICRESKEIIDLLAYYFITVEILKNRSCLKPID